MTIKSQKHVKFGDRKIGDGEPCFIVFEAGPTHSGIDSAKKLVTHAAEAGADAINTKGTGDPGKRTVIASNLPSGLDWKALRSAFSEVGRVRCLRAGYVGI